MTATLLAGPTRGRFLAAFCPPPGSLALALRNVQGSGRVCDATFATRKMALTRDSGISGTPNPYSYTCAPVRLWVSNATNATLATSRLSTAGAQRPNASAASLCEEVHRG